MKLLDPNSKNGKLVLTGLVVLIVVIIAYVFYKIVIQFKNSEVRNYINAEAAKTENPEAAAKILTDGCKSILMSHTRTNQVLTSAKASGVPREQELVHAALMAARAHGYLEA